MHISEIENILAGKFDLKGFLNLSGELTGDKIAEFVKENFQLPGNLHVTGAIIHRGSVKGPEAIGIYAVQIPVTTLRHGFKLRRQIANYILNKNDHNDAIIAFYSNNSDSWRLGFVRGYKFDALESLREFHVGINVPLKTVKSQLLSDDKVKKVIGLPISTEIGERQKKLNEAFSIEAVSDEFYDEYQKNHFSKIIDALKYSGQDEKDAEDLAVLFTIRIMFLGFVQKKGWLNEDQNYLKNLYAKYKAQNQTDKFYSHWLKPLFFEALNGFGNHIDNEYLPKDILTQYKMLPYLNGGLYLKHKIDNIEANIPDELINKFFNFLFSYNFTIEENTLQEQSLELNPELLGIIFERLVNKKNGAVYTPRTEVDFMCRISLVKWLQKNIIDDAPDVKEYYELLFREKGNDKEFDDDQKYGSFSANQKQKIITALKGLAICDPAVGSGAFPVGMMQVLNEVLENLGEPADQNSRYERKKVIIGRNLYGVEVNEWAVWICQLRLWLSMFIDAPEELRHSLAPILPSLDFKILQGDSLVQRLGTKLIPVNETKAIGNPIISNHVKKLSKLKADYYLNHLAGNHINNQAYIHSQESLLAKQSLQVEIDSLKTQLQHARVVSRLEQKSIFGDEKLEQLDLPLEQILEIESKINDLIILKESLKDQPTTIWSISFAEVFAAKGGFDIIIGNPPYIRHEDIIDPINTLGPSEYKKLIAEVIRIDYWPSLDFEKFKKTSGYLANSDLLIYFFLHTLKLLNSKGVHTFITQNSWLDVEFGAWFQNKLLSSNQVFGIFDSSERTFKNAATNTVISVIFANQTTRPVSNYKFIMLKNNYANTIFTENLIKIENTENVISNDLFRVYPVNPKKLHESGSLDNKYIGDKWGGKYLRAPDIYFLILEKGVDSLIKLRDIADVRRGFTTGANDFFYLEVTDDSKRDVYSCKNSAGWEGEIEKEFIRPVIKSPKECTSVFVNHKELPTSVFVCCDSKKNLVGTKALDYINWGENYKIQIKQGKNKGKWLDGYHQIDTVRNRKYWYALPEQEFAYSSSPMINNNRLINILNAGVFNDANLVGTYPYNKSYRDDNRLLASLNATYNMINWELNGITNLGEGAIKLNASYIKRSDIINPELLPKNIPTGIFSRKVQSIFEECGIDPESSIPIEEQEPDPLTDRLALDTVVFDALGLTQEERKDVYRAVCRLVYNRISKAKSV